MRRNERARVPIWAFGGILPEGRIGRAAVLGLSAVALQAAALERTAIRLGPDEETVSQSADDAFGDAVLSSIRRRGAVSAPPPAFSAQPEEARRALPEVASEIAIAADVAGEPPTAPFDARHPLRGPPPRCA